jgi:hypothetical protein
MQHAETHGTEQHPGEGTVTAAADDKQVGAVGCLDQGRHRMSDHEDALDGNVGELLLVPGKCFRGRLFGIHITAVNDLRFGSGCQQWKRAGAHMDRGHDSAAMRGLPDGELNCGRGCGRTVHTDHDLASRRRPELSEPPQRAWSRVPQQMCSPSREGENRHGAMTLRPDNQHLDVCGGANQFSAG